MGESYLNINLHIIFHIKYSSCEMSECDLPRIFNYMGGIIRSLSGHAYKIGGRPDHIHILTSLPLNLSVPDFVRKIKSNSSRWIKGLSAEYERFSWQSGYAAFSVSESNKKTIVSYISNQKKHHATRSASEEFLLFLQKNGIHMTHIETHAP